MNRIFPYLVLMRPANIITAIADVMAGYAIAGLIILNKESIFSFHLATTPSFIFLVLSTIGLYGGGVVLNDVFDLKLDKKERPERPLPSGKASLRGAITLSVFLFGTGVFSAFQASQLSGSISVVIVFLVILYDSFSKHYVVLGPLNMGACRGANLLMAVAVSPNFIDDIWFVGFIPVIYIAAITLISQGEVKGGKRWAIFFAFIMFMTTILFILILGFSPYFETKIAGIFLVLFGILIFPPLYKAWINPEAMNIRKAVKTGVLALIAMDAAMAAGFAGWQYAIIILLLLPVSIFLAKIFAVT